MSDARNYAEGARLIPKKGALVLEAHVDGEAPPLSVWCVHRVFQDYGDVGDVVARFEARDPCRVIELREVYHPARLAERLLVGDAGLAAFFLANPPEECRCDPDLAVQAVYPALSGAVVINLEHEPWCERSREAKSRPWLYEDDRSLRCGNVRRGTPRGSATRRA